MTCKICGAALPEGAMFCGECGSSVNAKPVARAAVVDRRPSDTTVLHRGADAADDAGEVSEARARRTTSTGVISIPVPDEFLIDTVDVPPAVPTRFTLRFSTGEVLVVTGGGLLGRRPVAQPGEHPEQLLTIADEQRSVSKTHLELGVENGELWVCDRYSANGSVIIPTGAAPRLCEPGRRYRVARGSRVEIGDQYFDLA